MVKCVMLLATSAHFVYHDSDALLTFVYTDEHYLDLKSTL